MLLKLLVLAALAHQISACCLPDRFQLTMLSETRYGDMEPIRASITMGMNLTQGRAAIVSRSQYGESGVYIDFVAGKAYTNGFGSCRQIPIEYVLPQLNATRCLPTESMNGSLPIEMAGGVRARFYAVNQRTPYGNVSVDAVVSERCQPIIVKVGGRDFESINIFGDFREGPQPGFLELPGECRNATRSAGRGKRHVVALPYGHAPLIL